jgi:RHS repeat-associated protein
MWDATSGGNQIQTVVLQLSGGVPTNRLTSVTDNGVTKNYAYDLAGNLTSDGVHTYQYDAEGRLAKLDAGSANESSYFYDANNWRVKKVVGTGGSAVTTNYIWEGAVVIAEYSSAGVQGSGGTRYYHQDRLSTRLITDGNGGVMGTNDHLPFGEDAGTTGTPEKHRFTNYERDSESGTDQAVNRQHQPSNGRFMQPDAILGRLINPQSLNRYTYTQNEPIDLVDPLGLEECFKRLPDGREVRIPCSQMKTDANGGIIVKADPDKNPLVPDFSTKANVIFVEGFGFLLGDSGYQDRPCAAIANRAQDIANQAISYAGGANRRAVRLFDRAFSKAYLGNTGLGETPGSAVNFFFQKIRPRVPINDLGEDDFKPEFRDNEGDQTHHFAAFLSAGINGQTGAAALHYLGTDTLALGRLSHNNPADRALGMKAFGAGAALIDEPVILRVIGTYIARNYCN